MRTGQKNKEVLGSLCKNIALAVLLCFAGTAFAKPSLDVEVQSFGGNAYSLSQFTGQVVYVDFWASWCLPCRKSFPWMNKMHHLYGEHGLKVIAINLDSDKELARQFLQKLPADFTISYDPETHVATQFEVIGMPSSYLFDRRGDLVKTHVGFFSENIAQYQAEIIELLKQDLKTED